MEQRVFRAAGSRWNEAIRLSFTTPEEGAPLNDAAEHVEELEAACHGLLDNMEDDARRALLLEAIVKYKTLPRGCFPPQVRDLVDASWDQADKLCLRILETSAASGGSIEQEAREMCHTLASIGAALKVG